MGNRLVLRRGTFGIEGEHNPDLLTGVIGKLPENRLSILVKRLNTILEYKVKIRKHDEKVGNVAIVTGQGFVPRLIQAAKERGARDLSEKPLTKLRVIAWAN